MTPRTFARGHADVHAPALRIVLFAQDPPRFQGVLFTSPALEARTEPPCDHPEGGWQREILGEIVYCCTFCGAELPEPEVERARVAHRAAFAEHERQRQRYHAREIGDDEYLVARRALDRTRIALDAEEAKRGR